MVPLRNHEYYDKLGRDPRFDMVGFYSPGSSLFTGTDADNPLDVKRKQLRGSTELIAVWEMNKRGRSYANVRVDKVLDLTQNLVP